MELSAFKEFIKGKGLRYTREREVIMREISSTRGHFNPEELFIDMRARGLKVSKASVYRTVALLIECGILKEVEKTDKHAHYEVIAGSGHHDHMLCNSCGRVIEFYSKRLEKLQDDLCKQEGFKSVSHTLEIMGFCSDCKPKS